MRPPDTHCRSFSPHKTLALLALVMVGAFLFAAGCGAQQVADDAKRLESQLAELQGKFPELGERIAAIEARRIEVDRELQEALRTNDLNRVFYAQSALDAMGREVADAKLLYPELARQIRDANSQSTRVAVGAQSVADQANFAGALVGKAAGAVGIDTGASGWPSMPSGEIVGTSAGAIAALALAWWMKRNRDRDRAVNTLARTALPPFDHLPSTPTPAPPARGYSATPGAAATGNNGQSGAYTVPHGAEAKT